eukprot:359460-Chlamydomonas_euryale.AAC.2
MSCCWASRCTWSASGRSLASCCRSEASRVQYALFGYGGARCMCWRGSGSVGCFGACRCGLPAGECPTLRMWAVCLLTLL